MFDIGFSEIALIAVVALIVLGPERLPKAARTVGALLRRARASWHGVKSEIERELAAEDLKRSLAESRRAADIGDELRSLKSDLTSPLPMKPLTPTPAPADPASAPSGSAAITPDAAASTQPASTPAASEPRAPQLSSSDAPASRHDRG